MKNFFKSENGINLVSLAVAIIILIVLTNVVLYNVKDNLGIQGLKNMQSDIQNLSDNVSSYYTQYGKVPAKIKYNNQEKINNLSDIIGKNDTGDFYIIDLQAMDNITLTYGADYEKIKEDTSATYDKDLEDLYIINEDSHNIFYVKGIKNENEIFYTTYTKDDVDKNKLELKYVDNIKIPESYEYVSGNKNSGIKIKDKNSSNTYTWIVEEEKLTQIPTNKQIDGIEGKEDEFLDSVNRFSGYYKNDNNNYVIYIEVLEKWSPIYDKTAIYTDINEDTAYIPKGFCVSRKDGENTINDGLVIKKPDSADESSMYDTYVWIQVPESIFTSAFSEEDYEEIERNIKTYTKSYQKEGFSDTWYLGCGINTLEEYTQLKNKMLRSIYKYHGFWISQYEIGTNLPRTTRTDDTGLGNASSRQGQYPYSNVTCAQAQYVAKNKIDVGEDDNISSSLMFGMQWDLICKFFESTQVMTKNEITSDSKEFGNYISTIFNIKNGKYNILDSNMDFSEARWVAVDNDKFEKQNPLVYTSGANKKARIKNIYDLAGNIWELTLEKSEQGSTLRGGAYNHAGTENNGALGDRYEYPANGNYYHIGFRTTLFL